MKRNIPRAAIHVGTDKKSFSSQVGNEAERRGWDEKRYQLKNADIDKNNHYNYSRKRLNFEIVKGGKIVPLGSQSVPLHERLQHRLDELGFKPYMDAKRTDQVSRNSPNCTVGIIFSGDHDVLNRLAFGEQKLNTSDPNADHSKVVLQKGIYDWALDTYRFACEKWGEENVIGFDVHCDETSIHAHVQTVPVEQVRKRGRIGSKYIHKDNPEKVLSTKEWRALPKEERDNYTKLEAAKGVVERVSYAKVWGERAKDKSQYLSQLHTDYYNKVGHKYGLARGFSYDELSEEEKRGRKHKNKVVIEAERQAKVALDKVEKYAVLATIDKKELTIPLLNIKAPVQEAMNAVKKELAIPIPTIIGQKAWREERTTNINDAIKALVAAINAERDKQNEGVRKSVNKTYTYYMQNLNKQIEENKSLRAENDALKAENNKVKQHISQLDEKAVERVTTQLVCAKEELASAKSYNTTLLEMYNDLKARWNAIWQEPEMTDAWRRVEARKEEDAKEKARQEAETKRESLARQDRYIGVLDKFIREGYKTLSSFAKTDRVNFNEKESASIYYGIMASAVKHNIGLDSKACIESAAKSFLSGMSWKGFTDFKQECVTSWTKLFATNEVQFTDKAIDNFLAFVDYMSCSADTYVSLGGSNGCADQLTNWDGTQKVGLGSILQKKGKRISL
ncbi:plasmid recombination protein [Prevotella copri]|uniref:MobV family relaxase n=1 Tax=Segatella copri TaxID=165179 RepID=UPI001C2BE4EC|nr:MobV family relaxase [Segatella copri]MBU9907625.1 plasmid recombination protein [Segatella copri]MBV3373200.1 plasmid recombination protein [Segatella copri]